MSVNSLIERSRSVLGNTSVLGDITFATGKGITSIGDIVLQDTKAIKTGVAANDLFYLDLYDADGAAYVHGLTAYGGINAPNFSFDVPVTFNGNLVAGTMDIDDDSGAVTLVDMDVTDAPVAGTEQSYAFKVDGTMIAKVYAEADSAGGIQNPAFVIGTGVPIKGHSWVVENHTADDTLTLAESGSVHTNYGAGGAVALKLPASATAGTTFKFVVGAAQELRVVVAASGESFIVNGGTSTDDTGNDLYLVADDEGEMATFTCIAAGVWLVDVVGTWTPTQP